MSLQRTGKPKRDYGAFKTKMKRHGRHMRPNADSTISALGSISDRWDSYCAEVLQEDGDASLRGVDVAELKTFFQWLVDNARGEPQQAGSLKQYFRVLKMRYKSVTGIDVEKEAVMDVNNFIDHHLEGKKETSPRSKPVPSGADFVNMVHFHYAKDTARYKNERQRVQQAFLMIIHAGSGLRPSSTTQTSTSRKSIVSKSSLEHEDPDDSSEQHSEGPSLESAVFKLRYRDLQLSALRTERGMRYSVTAKFRHFKGESRRAQHKTFRWLDQDDVLTCPVSHLVALALQDKAFLSGISTAGEFFDVSIPEGEEEVLFCWRHDLLDYPVMRTTPDLHAPELSNSATLKRLSTLGKVICGYKYQLTWYCLRRMVLNAVDGMGSEEARNQISGHLDSRTYRAHYLDQHIHVDVIAAVKGKKSEGELIREINSMGTSADPAANRPLSEATLQTIENLPEMVEASTAFRAAAEAVKEAFHITKNAPSDHPLYKEYIKTGNAYRALKQKLRSQWQSAQRQAYFEAKSTAIIKSQLYNEGQWPSPRSPEQNLPDYSPERAYLAALTKITTDIRSGPLEQRTAAVHALAKLCTQVAPKPTKSQSRTSPTATFPSKCAERKHNDFPLRCHKLQCLFCLGDERLCSKDQTRRFCREQKLWEHIATSHMSAIKQLRKIQCPHPRCRRASVTLQGIQHLKNHAQTVHGIRLQRL